MPSVRLDNDVFASVLKIKLELSEKEGKDLSMSETIRMLVTYCPVVEKGKLPLKRLY